MSFLNFQKTWSHFSHELNTRSTFSLVLQVQCKNVWLGFALALFSRPDFGIPFLFSRLSWDFPPFGRILGVPKELEEFLLSFTFLISAINLAHFRSYVSFPRCPGKKTFFFLHFDWTRQHQFWVGLWQRSMAFDSWPFFSTKYSLFPHIKR